VSYDISLNDGWKIMLLVRDKYAEFNPMDIYAGIDD
jgi:hypothetical protein